MNSGTNNKTKTSSKTYKRKGERRILCETFFHPPPVGKQHFSVEYSVLTIKLDAHKEVWSQTSIPHFTNEETEPQKGQGQQTKTELDPRTISSA